MRVCMEIYKWLVLLVFFGLAFTPALCQVHSEIAMPPNGDNERAEISQWIGLVKVTIDYHSPNVHGGGGADHGAHLGGTGELRLYRSRLWPFALGAMAGLGKMNEPRSPFS